MHYSQSQTKPEPNKHLQSHTKRKSNKYNLILKETRRALTTLTQNRIKQRLNKKKTSINNLIQKIESQINTYKLTFKQNQISIYIFRLQHHKANNPNIILKQN